jgi:hypothetical protein
VFATFVLDVSPQALSPSFAANFESRLALFLSVEPEQVRVVSIIAGSSVVRVRVWEADETAVRRTLGDASIFTLTTVLGYSVLDKPTLEPALVPSPPVDAAPGDGGGGGRSGAPASDGARNDNTTPLRPSTVAAIAGAVAVVVVLLALAVLRQRHARELARKAAVVAQAFRSTRSFGYPIHLLRAETFLQMRTLRKFEPARNQRHHLVVDLVEDAAKMFAPESRNRLIFLSHQWLGYNAPDPSGVQREVMAAGVRHVAETNGWALSHATFGCARAQRGAPPNARDVAPRSTLARVCFASGPEKSTHSGACAQN